MAEFLDNHEELKAVFTQVVPAKMEWKRSIMSEQELLDKQNNIFTPLSK